MKEENEREISRRKFLKTTGASIAALGLGAYSGDKVAQAVKQNIGMKTTKTPAGAATGGQDYEEITVDAGETWSYNISDGETFENYLFDVTANGAGIEIRASAADWTIRNVGVRGADSGTAKKFMFGLSVTSGTGLMENIYLGDGDEPWANNRNKGEAPIYVYGGSHAGTLEFRNVYIEEHGDNGLYASDPGHPGRGGGEVHVYDSYSGHNQGSNFRLGTNGSFIDNCCSWGGPHRGFWGYFEHTEIRNSHIGGMDKPNRAVEVGEPAHDKSANAEVTVIDSQYQGYQTRESTNKVHIEGSSGTNPQKFIPEGTPTKPEEAASGAASGGSTGTGTGSSGGSRERCTEEDYETIKVSAGETRTIHIDDNNPLENTLIDISEPKADVRLRASGSNWRIENVGIKGHFDKEEPKAKFVPYVEAGGEAIVDGLYMPGTNLDTPNRVKNVWVQAHQHQGTLTFRNCFFKNGADNQLYCSGPAKQQGPEQGGEVNFENCHSQNAGVSHYRVGQTGSHIRNCTVLCDETVPPVPSPPFGDNRSPRGVWVPDGGEVEVEGCDIYVDPPHKARQAVLASETSTIHLRNCRVHGEIGSQGHPNATINQENVTSNPDPSPNPGVPTSPEEAACGASSAGTGSTTNTLKISNNSSTTAHYIISSEHKIEPENTNEEDFVFTNKATGSVAGGTDSYTLHGQPKKFHASSDVTITWNGQEMSAEEFQTVCQN